MPVKKLKPYTPTTRTQTIVDFSELTSVRPKKNLLITLPYKAGRGAGGRISVRHKGGRVKRRYRIIDFKRDKHGVPAVVKSIEYDPNRSAFISLLCYADGEYRYILAPHGIKVGDKLESGKHAEIQLGNALPLSKIPPGTSVHCIELQPGKGAQLARTAGSFGVISAKDGDYVTVKLPSSEVRKIHKDCMATVGELSNKDHNLVSLGKAGRKRWLGVRPTVRGVAMNPVDHPHGGGEGKTSGGRHPVSPTGLPTKGYKTRTNSKSDKFIVQKRKRNRNR